LHTLQGILPKIPLEPLRHGSPRCLPASVVRFSGSFAGSQSARSAILRDLDRGDAENAEKPSKKSPRPPFFHGSRILGPLRHGSPRCLRVSVVGFSGPFAESQSARSAALRDFHRGDTENAKKPSIKLRDLCSSAVRDRQCLPFSRVGTHVIQQKAAKRALSLGGPRI